MADLSYPVAPAQGDGFVQGRSSIRFESVSPAPPVGRLLQDPRINNPISGTISDQVVLKTVGGEQPFVNGRVWLLRLADGYKAWEGWSDAGGWYTATGLEVGVDYVAVAIDPLRNHKTTGAGPVVAT